jgi:hypothetical protein
VVIEVDGLPGQTVQWVAPNPVSEQSIRILQMLFDKAYELSGINQQSSSGKSVLGSNASGKALDTMEDIQSDRFAHVEAGWMQARVGWGFLLVDGARELYEDAKNPKESGITKADLAPWIRSHEWDKVTIDEGDYHLTIEPINFLPDSRAGKLSFVAELSKAGLIPDPTMTADLFDEPDIARANRSILGPKHRIDQMLEGVADPDVELIEILPDKYDNLPLALLMGKGEMKHAQADLRNESPATVELILGRYRQWIDHVKQAIETSRPDNAASLGGMQANNMGAAMNASDMMMAGGAPAAGPPVPGMPPGADAGMGIPPGMIQ